MRTCSCRLALLVVATLAAAGPAEDLRALTGMRGDSAQVAEDWHRYAVPYLDAANSVTSPHQSLLRGNDRAALDVMRTTDRMLRHYLGDD